MKYVKLIVLFLLVGSLVGCGAYQYATAEKETNKATKEQQQEVKNQVMKLLEQEYKQPFKLESFKYKYERVWEDPSCQMSFCKMVKVGIYKFKVQAVDNPIILINFQLVDNKELLSKKDRNKESIKGLIDSFKKNQLKEVYCSAFTDYYYYVRHGKQQIKQPYTEQTEKYCDSIDQTGYKLYKDAYLKGGTT